jgi:hypothetical protein
MEPTLRFDSIESTIFLFIFDGEIYLPCLLATRHALGSVVKRKEDRSEIESGKKGIRAFSIPSSNTSPLFKPPKYTLNEMALLIQLCVISPHKSLPPSDYAWKE